MRADVVDCSVLVPVLNEERHIAASLSAMRRQRFPGQLEFVIVDGGSTDRTLEVLRELALADPRIRLLSNPRRIIPSGLNMALRNARGRWVARMDAHSEYPVDYIERGVERLRRGDTRWVSGPQIAVGSRPVGKAVALALETPLGRGASARWGRAGAAADSDYELDSGVFCGVWERETLLEHGGWDERWPRNEDSELAARFFERGERLIGVPAMAARYSPRETLSSLSRQYFENGEFRVRTALWHPHTLRPSNLLPAAVVLAALASVGAPSPIRRVARAAVGGYVAAITAAGGRAVFLAGASEEAALVPVVLGAMHGAFGAGFMRGIAHHGLPLAALIQAAGFGRLAQRFARAPQPVFAPSLTNGQIGPRTMA